MGNLMSCVVICGAVEVVQLVHSDGHVERLIRPLEQKKLGNSPVHEQVAAAHHSYLLLPISSHKSNAGDGIFKYKRMSSFQFYKSALLSHKQSTCKSSKAVAVAPSSSSSSPEKSVHRHKRNGGEGKQLLVKDSQPFKVRQEGGVTKLVVSKRYLAQLLSESNIDKSNTSSSSSKRDKNVGNGTPTPSGSGIKTSLESSSTTCAPRVGRPGIWRPALESISEAAHAPRL